MHATTCPHTFDVPEMVWTVLPVVFPPLVIVRQVLHLAGATILHHHRVEDHGLGQVRFTLVYIVTGYSFGRLKGLVFLVVHYLLLFTCPH